VKRVGILLVLTVTLAPLFWSCEGQLDVVGGVDLYPQKFASRGIDDGAHSIDGEPGDPRFFFLPPIVSNPGTHGTFDSSLNPVVTIEELETGELIESFTMSRDRSGSGVIRVNTRDEFYIVNWHTRRSKLDTDKRYIIRGFADSFEFGSVTLRVFNRRQYRKNAAHEKLFALVIGRMLPIKFRFILDPGSAVGPAGGTVTALDGNVALDFPAGALSDEIDISVESVDDLSALPAPDSLLPGSVYNFGPDGTQFDIPVELKIAYNSVPDDFEESQLTILKLVDDAWHSLPSMVDVVEKVVTANIESFSLYAVGSESEDGIAIAGRWSFLDNMGYVVFTISDTEFTWARGSGSSGSGSVSSYDNVEGIAAIYNTPEEDHL
jgi:hypothetical protein